MGTSSDGVLDDAASDRLEQIQNPDSSVHEAKSNLEGITCMVYSGDGVLNGVASDRQEPSQSSDSTIHEAQSNQKGVSCMFSKDVVSDGPASDGLKQSQTLDPRTHEKEFNQRGAADIITSREGVSNAVGSDQLKEAWSPKAGVHEAQPSQEAVTPVIIEKASEDGYNWRKYGQKHVKGNEFIRSYYKCTHPNCQVKKHLERSHDGQLTDTLYFGKHDHPKPQFISVASGSILSIQEERSDELSTHAEDKSSDAHGQPSHCIDPADNPKLSIVIASDTDLEGVRLQPNRIREEVDNDEDPEPKRRKKDYYTVDATQADKQAAEPRVVVQTESKVDIVNDGYRWRKYGQKLVKGNPNPRSYYRCSNMGCPVKKHVERASHDPKIVITTYEGQHDHDMPPARTVTQNSNATALNSESRAKAEEIGGHEVVIHYSLHPEGRSNEQRGPGAEPVQG
ncbi:WRKY transcription factor 1-like isoform X2 [Malania oleifera]|uniref:WRKY transcription factor 1-like isoform X2 n=1 Tax=Malania oleifera TaxID=397392 RepID=UPI0025ADD702|nr:WRKY transcription factor 1-like isoform X2 [Malania oleifera]XP_057956708.1 WRKY transcription factor 1-like isoform X2 [Malania oleifera]XP_057956709.1 WRKY transcription factor 1-like isoform X2 [Malania oleifera]